MKSTKTVLTTLLMVGVVAALLGGATYAVFSDTEESVGNQMIAGTIDFEVDGENPWTTSTWSEDLGDMKPCVVHYGEFAIENVGRNPMNLWKKLTVTGLYGGADNYADVASSEPEYVEGGGEFDSATGLPTGAGYDERCNIAAYTLYDMTVTINGSDPVVLISDDQQVRIDNVNGVYVYLGQLPAGYTMTVNQSYHLSSWIGAVDPTVTNWAQGDVMEFTVELYGEQITGPGPVTGIMMANLDNKHSTTWEPIADGTSGKLYYNVAGPTFDYVFEGIGLETGTAYSLIYYADPTPGTGGTLIDSGVAVAGVVALADSVDTGDMPVVGDNNYPAGAKLWLVLAADYDEIAGEMTAWNPDEYLFDMNLITYDDTSAP